MRKILIAAGHSGECEKGSIGYFDEKEEAISLVHDIMEVIMEKSEDAKLSIMSASSTNLMNRIFAVNAWCKKTGFAVEFHFNKFNGTASGVECLVSDHASANSMNIANDLCGLISKTLGLYNRKMKREFQSARGKLGFVSNTACPAVIVEVCFLDNDVDVKKYKLNRYELVNQLADYFIKKAEL